MNFYQKFIHLCNETGKSPSAAILEIGLKKSAVTRWKKGGNPTDATVDKICAYFKIDSSYFSSLQNETPTVPGIPESRQAFIEKVLSMSDAEFDKLVKLFELWNEGR